MSHRYVALLLVACTFATFSPLRTFAQDTSDIVITEIQWGGSALSTADEWIEFANTSEAIVDLSGWTLSGIGSSGSLITLPDASLLLPRETYLIANYALGDAKSVLDTVPQLVTSSLSIPNSDLSISLFDAQGNLVASYTDTGSPDFGSTSPHASMEYDLASEAWTTASTAVFLLGGETFGSPGFVDFPTEDSPDLSVASQELDGEEAVPTETLPEITDPTAEDSPTSSSLEDETFDLETSLPEDDIVPSDASVTAHPSEETSEEVLEEIVLIAPVPSEIISESVPDIDSPSASSLDEVEEVLPTSASDAIVPSSASSQITLTETIDYAPLVLSEFLSSPADGNEWVELWNSGDVSLDLSLVSFVEGSGKRTALSGMLAGGAYTLIENPSGKLNNDGDTLELVLSDGQLLTSLTYGTDSFPAPKKGFSAGACEDGWHTTLAPTPGAPNSCPTTSLESSSYATQTTITTPVDLSSADSGDSSATQGDLSSSQGSTSERESVTPITTSVITTAFIEETSSSSADEDSSSSHSSPTKKISKSTVIDVSLADLDALASGQRVRVEGVLVALPGTFGKRIAYIQGVQLYFYDADWPELAFGTTVSVTGTWDVDTNTRRIKIADAPDIAVMGTETVTPFALLDALALPFPGDVLVAAQGALTGKEGDIFIFTADDGSTFRAHDTAHTNALAFLKQGDHATITGMLFAEDGVAVLAPRSGADVASVAYPDASSVKLAASLTSSSQTPLSSSTPLIGGGILASSISALGYWFLRTRKFSFISH